MTMTGDTQRAILAELAAGMQEITRIVGLDPESGEIEPTVERVRALAAAAAVDDEATKEASLNRADEIASDAYRSWANTSNRDAYVDVAIRNAARGAALAALREAQNG